LKQKFDITGMSCAACSARIEKDVSKLNGLDQVSVNLLSNSMTVSYDPQKLSQSDIIKAVEDAGYGASLPNSNQDTKNPTAVKSPDPSSAMKKRLILSLIFTIPLFYIAMGHMWNWPLPSFLLGNENAIAFAFTQFLLMIPVVGINFSYYKNGYRSLLHRSPNMDSLIAIGSSAAIVYGIFAIYQIGYALGQQDMERVHTYSMDLYFESAAMIVTLITLGKFLESRAKGKTSEAITKLMNLTPKTASVLRGNEELQIPVEQIVPGDLVMIRSGETVPVDGMIVEGYGTVDESALTGESIPVEKTIGHHLTGASITRSGYFKMKAEKVGDDTTLSQIIRLVEEASSSKAPIAKLADRVSGIFVPVVISIAVLSTVIWLIAGAEFEFALSIGISVLVISCPCALGLATPTAIMVGTGKGAQNGILFRSAESLETAHHIQTVVLDKTGTITKGVPSVTDLTPVDPQQETMLLQIAASLEHLSEHPLGEAIVQKAKEQGIPFLPVEQFEAVPGQGICGIIDGQQYLAGNQTMMDHYGVPCLTLSETASRFADEGKTPLFFARENTLLGLIAVADTIKPTSADAVSALQSMGLEVIMLTGDNNRTAQAIQRQVGIQNVISDVLPQDKEKHIRLLQQQGKKVAMIGDGINDAPALARADVGIAIGAGTDIAIESADIILMKNDLMDAVSAIELSRAVLRNIKQNLFWAFFYNSIGIPLAAGVFFAAFGLRLSPMFAAAAMSFSSVCVVTNALRLKWFRPKAAGTKHNITSENQSLPIKEEKTMKKTILIEGMMCAHCSARVEQVLNAIDGVTATVNLEEKRADVTLTKDIADDVLTRAVTDAGYQVVKID
jgi:heavy metal translocating P-type ATPase